MDQLGPSRRSILRASALTAVAGVVGFLTTRRSDAAKPRLAGAAANAYGLPETMAPSPLIALDQVPVAGGVVLESRRVVVTRDAQGTPRAFSATCTHQGCLVDSVRDGEIRCPCHGSRFAAATGAVSKGPALSPLREIAVVVTDGEVFLA